MTLADQRGSTTLLSAGNRLQRPSGNNDIVLSPGLQNGTTRLDTVTPVFAWNNHIIISKVSGFMLSLHGDGEDGPPIRLYAPVGLTEIRAA
jgi:hypothetical protein